jgi:hypothetical protein
MNSKFFNKLHEAHEKGLFAKFIQASALSGELFNAIPELKILSQVPQDPRWHPEGDVWTHTLLVIENLPPNATFAMALSALFHDIGKTATTVVHETGRITAYGHENVSKKITSKILDSFEVALKLKSEVLFLVYRHMIAHSKDANIKTLRKLMIEAGPDLVDQLLLHGIADVKAGCGDFTDCIRLRELFNTLKISP